MRGLTVYNAIRPTAGVGMATTWSRRVITYSCTKTERVIVVHVSTYEALHVINSIDTSYM